MAIGVCSVVGAALILFIPHLRDTVNGFRPLETVLSELGATYGTILALVLTLSIIPIQRGAEAWSQSIVRLYRKDLATYATFVVLGIFCAASFLFSVRGLFRLPVSSVLALSIAALGISLDLLRWYHGHLCRLLDPSYAVDLAVREAERAIDRISKNVSRVARLQYRLLSAEQRRSATVETIESAIYPKLAGYPESVNRWINDLAEIGMKAVGRGERLLARVVTVGLVRVTIYYLNSRKANLILVPAPEAMFLAAKSDVGVITERVYEALQEVSRIAVSREDESTCIRVSEAFEKIAEYTACLRAAAFPEGTAPLTYSPLYYALSCVKRAQLKGLHDVVFQSAAILSRLCGVAPKNTRETEIAIPVIDGLVEMAAYLYQKREFVLAEEVTGHSLRILEQLLQREDFYFAEVLRHVLEKIEGIVPLALVNEAMGGRLSMVFPMSKAYGLTSPNSVGYLFERAAGLLPRVDAEREWINPYDDLAGIADIVAGHLRNIAENNEFGDSVLVWQVDKMIVYMAGVIANITDRPLRAERGDERCLVDRLGWLLAFYWVAFRGKKTVSGLRVNECCGSLMVVALQFFDRGYPEVLRVCISNIQSIVESYCEISKPALPYTIGDLFAHIWGIRMLLVARNSEPLIEEVDRALSAKPRALTDEEWQAAQEPIQLRQRQLEERLTARDARRGLRDGEALLRQLLDKTRGPVV